MGNSRPRYNQKGRGGDPNQPLNGSGKRSAYHLDEEEEHEGEDQLDNEDGDELSSRNKKVKPAQPAIAAKPEPKMSSKKKKRMEAYIARKLKKDDRTSLIASLANTQTTNLDLRSSSTLGSKQFKNQKERVEHSALVEERKRARAKDLLVKKKGKGGGYLSESGEDESEDEMDQDEQEERLISPPPQPTLPIPPPQTKAQQPAPLFNPSGLLGIVEVSAEEPVASTSTSVPPPAAEAKVGSGLKSDVVVRVVKRKPKPKGKMRELLQKGGAKKGKGKATEEAEEENSDFDSSASSDNEDEEEEEEDDMDGSDEKEMEEEFSDAESWYGVDGVKADVEPLLPDAGENASSEEDESGSEGSDDSEDVDDDVDAPPTVPQRTKGFFQSWADSQINLAATSTDPTTHHASLPSAEPLSEYNTTTPYDSPYVPLLPSNPLTKPVPSANPGGLITGPLGHKLAASELPSIPLQRTTNVKFNRTEEIEKVRAELPVVREEERVMEAVRGNLVVVICGETGSGKTTQIGQFLLEAGFGDKDSDNPGMIAITQPRRVAALSTSSRVLTELNLPSTSSVVAHKIRYSSTTAADTKLIFMTDGVLLRELSGDFLLKKFSVVVVDEAHERGVNTDVLIGVLSRVVRLREDMWKKGKEGIKPLRLIIMSATLRVTDFSSNATLFPSPPPIISINARQHPVTLHFSRRTSPHYLEEAFKKVARIHTRLPEGGVLVFCTGQNEIVSLVKKLEEKFGPKAVAERKRRREVLAGRERDRAAGKETVTESKEDEDGEVELGDDIEVEDMDLGERDRDLAADVDDGMDGAIEDDPDDLESSDDEEDSKIKGVDMEEDSDVPMYILPLYSLLPTEKQMKVFQSPPPNTRLVVIATNVAETSITIPNIKYVVDAGRAKERRFDPTSGIQTFEVSWISKASAAQRAGRAGRTGPGHCYRLYSSSVFENYFDEHTKPEILRMPIEGIVLQMKSMNIDQVYNFPFPTPPDRESLRRAEKTLVNLGALENHSGSGGKITELGRAMSLFPISPRFSKMIVAGQQQGCLPYVIAIVCALSVGDPFIREGNLGDEDSADGEGGNDAVLTRGEIAHIRDPALRAKEELKATRKSFFEVQNKYLALGKGSSDVFKVLSVVGAYEYDGGKESFCSANFVRGKAMQEIHKLRSQISQIVQSTYPGLDAGFVPKLKPPTDVQLKILRQLITSAFIDQVAVRKDLIEQGGISYGKVASTRGVPYRTANIDEDLFIHPSSGLFHNPPPEFLVYQDVHRTTKPWLKTVTKINSAWLPVLGKPLCTFSKPLETPTTTLATAAKAKEVGASKESDTRQSFVVPRFCGVELKPILAEQKLVKGRWVFV